MDPTLHHSFFLDRISLVTVVVWLLLLVSTLVLSAKELFQFLHSQRLYFTNWENWIQWGIILNVLMVSFHSSPFNSLNTFTYLVSRFVYICYSGLISCLRWQHHAAAIGVFFVWGELMLMIGRLPTFGIYVQVKYVVFLFLITNVVFHKMFTTVARNFFKFLAAYFCLLVAFALSFCVLFPHYQSFNIHTGSALVNL